MIYWLLTTEYPPLFGGGIGTYCHHTARMLHREGHVVTVFLPDDSVTDHAVIMDDGIRLVRFNSQRGGMGRYLGYVPRLSYAFALVVQEFLKREDKPDFIESQEYLAIPYFLIQFKLLGYPVLRDVPIVLTLHSPAFLYLLYNREGIYEFPNYWTGEMEVGCIQGADLIIAPSSYIIEEINKHTFIPSHKVAVVRNPYEAGGVISSPPAVTRNEIVFYGKLSPQKGAFELFRYFKDLWDNGFTHKLIVIGGTDKVYYPEMKTMEQVLRAEYKRYFQQGLVSFTGKILPDKRDVHLSAAHVVLIPSNGDNLPYAAIEAMCIGKVVLASVQGGQREFIEDGINGFLFDHNIPNSFEEKLLHILSLDKDSLLRIGQAAMESIAEGFSYASIYAQKLATLQGLRPKKSLPHRFPFARPIDAAPHFYKTPMARGLLSVVIPFYNMGRFIDDCVNSVLQSSYKDLEVLIVDDGSTDSASLEALKRWAAHPLVHVVQKKNEGIAATRNHGASLANGEYLAFLDADDKVHGSYYLKAITVLQQYENVFFVGAWSQYFGQKNDVWPAWNPEPPYILLHNSVNSSALVYKKAAYLAGGLNVKDVDYGLEDYGSVISMLAHGYRGVVLPECLFFYRVRRDSMYRGLNRYKVLHSYHFISSQHDVLYRQYAPQLFNLLNANGPSFAYDNPSFGRRVTSSSMQPHQLAVRAKGFVKQFPALKKLLLQIKAFIRL